MPPPQEDAPFSWSTVANDARRTQWSHTNARAALLCLPAIATWVFWGLADGQRRWFTLAAAGAVSVGFGAFQRLGETRLVPMAITLAGIGCGVWLGSFAGGVGWPWSVLAATIAGYGFGVMTTLGYAAWWIGLHWMIALVVYGAQAANPAGATSNALAVFVGGTSQLIILGAVRPWTHHWFRRQDQPSLEIDEPLFCALVKRADPRSPAGMYATRAALGIGGASLIYHACGLSNGYWMPMTVAILLKPRLHDTMVRGVNRLVGTLAGAGLTTFFVATFRPGPPWLGFMLLLAVWGAYTFQKVNYAMMATGVTAYVVFLSSMIGLPETAVALHRVTATLGGACIALVVHVRRPGRSGTAVAGTSI